MTGWCVNITFDKAVSRILSPVVDMATVENTQEEINKQTKKTVLCRVLCHILTSAQKRGEKWCGLQGLTKTQSLNCLKRILGRQEKEKKMRRPRERLKEKEGHATMKQDDVTERKEKKRQDKTRIEKFLEIKKARKKD